MNIVPATKHCALPSRWCLGLLLPLLLLPPALL
jgi:hypothetical protein